MEKSTFLEKARSIHGYKYRYIDLVNDIKVKDLISFECKEIIYNQKVSKHLLGKCPEKRQYRTGDMFIKKSTNIWGDRFDYSDVVYINSHIKVSLFDKYTNRLIKQTPLANLSGVSDTSMDTKYFISISKVISKEVYSYDKTEYINKTTKLVITCHEHGDFLVTPFNHISYGEVCKMCNQSNICKEIKKYLHKNNISYDLQHRFNDINVYSLPFDFYIPITRCVINIGYVDKAKREYCEDNFINTIDLSYNSNVEDILNSSFIYDK